jgi:hypothetical protein
MYPPHYAELSKKERKAFDDRLQSFLASISRYSGPFAMTSEAALDVMDAWEASGFTLEDVMCLGLGDFNFPLNLFVTGPIATLLSAVFYSGMDVTAKPQFQVPALPTSAFWTHFKERRGPDSFAGMGKGFAYLYRAMMCVSRTDLFGSDLREKIQAQNSTRIREYLAEYYNACVRVPQAQRKEPLSAFVKGFVDALVLQEMGFSTSFQRNGTIFNTACELKTALQWMDDALGFETLELDLTRCVWVEGILDCDIEDLPYFQQYPDRLPRPVQTKPRVALVIKRMVEASEKKDYDVVIDPKLLQCLEYARPSSPASSSSTMPTRATDLPKRSSGAIAAQKPHDQAVKVSKGTAPATGGMKREAPTSNGCSKRRKVPTPVIDLTDV